MPAFVRGVAVIRGVPVPVVDAASVLEERAACSPHPSRFVALKTGGRRVALAVDEVLGVKEIRSTNLAELPPLLAGARERTAAMAILDNELLLVLQSARFVPDGTWNLIESGEAR